jgi:hypothetical protein
LLEFLNDIVRHIIFGLYLTWEVLLLVDEAQRQQDALLQFEELTLLPERFVEFVEQVREEVEVFL